MKKAFIFIGTSGSGKSTLSRLFAKKHNLKTADVLEPVLEILEKTRKRTLTDGELRFAYILSFHVSLKKQRIS